MRGWVAVVIQIDCQLSLPAYEKVSTFFPLSLIIRNNFKKTMSDGLPGLKTTPRVGAKLTWGGPDCGISPVS